MFSPFLAMTSAVLWGTADFAGGKASQRADARTVTLFSQLSGLPLLAVLVVLLGGRPLDLAGFAWSAAGGVCGFIGLAFFYRGLASGSMAVVAPITGVVGAVVPLVAGLAIEGSPGPLPLAGVLVAITAIALVSGSPAGARAVRRGVVLLAVAAGVMFGLLFVLLDRVDPASGVWSLVGTRAGSIALGVLLYAGRGRVRLTSGPIRWTVLAGVLDISANACFVVAVHLGALSVVGPVASLYPASTVLLALTVERERVGPTQLVGLGLAATALVLVAA